MHIIYRALFSLLIFNTTFSCELPADLYPCIIIYALDKNITFVRVLKQVSKGFCATIDKPEIMKTIIAQNIGPMRGSDCCAGIINTLGSQKYEEVNMRLMNTWDIDAYLKILKGEPYADINCQLIYEQHYTCKLQEVRSLSSWYYKEEDKHLWIKTLLDHGANPHLIFYDDGPFHKKTSTVFEQLNDGILCGSSVDENTKKRRLGRLKIFLEHNALADKKYIETKHLSINEALKQQPVIYCDKYRYETWCQDRRPFMTWCVDYLTLIAKYDFDIKTVQPHPLHYHLHNNADPAPVMVKYLVQEQHCDPYEVVDLGDVSEPKLESPYTIVSKLSDEPTKQELLAIFKTVKKQI
jgi:hypothetical protein